MVFTVRLPGSTANLGPGYDVLGLALGIYNRVTVRVGETDSNRIASKGQGSEELPTNGTNLFFRAAKALARRADRDLPAIDAEMEVSVPLSRGLGSSSTAIVGGVVCANRLLGDPLSQPELLDLATEIEGHPDNVSPCLYGGFTVSTVSNGRVTCVRSEPSPELQTLVVIPNFPLKTKEARAALPASVSHEDATYNVGQACVVTAAMLKGDLDALASAMNDRLHQPHRASLIPHYELVTSAGLDAGALGVALSGAGPTLFAFSRGDTIPIGEAMVGAWKNEGIQAVSYALPVDLDGTVIE